MTDDGCGGCKGIGSHRKHCRQNPNYSYWRELADLAESLGDRIGPNEMGAANSCYRAASLLRAKAAEETG